MALMFLQRITLFWKRFSPIEARLLAESRSVLPLNAQAIFDAQVGAINLVSRLPPDWSSIMFYRRKRGKTDWSNVPLFPCTEERRVVQVRFKVKGTSYKATLHSIEGHIFDFSISPGSKPIAFAEWDGPASTKLLSDPCSLQETERHQTETIPTAWRDFVTKFQQSESTWIFHDESTAYRVTLSEGEYLVLAECEGAEFILWPTDSTGSEFFIVKDISESPKPFDGDFEMLFRGNR